jgi:hypothetical protein
MDERIANIAQAITYDDESVSDDELFYYLENGGVITYTVLFNDKRVALMERIYSIMIINDWRLIIPCVGVIGTKMFLISEIIWTLNRTYQLVALESFYLAGVQYGFSLVNLCNAATIFSFDYAKDYEKFTPVLQWWFDKFDLDSPLFLPRTFDSLIIRGDMNIFAWYERVLSGRTDVHLSYNKLMLRNNPMETLNWLYRMYQCSHMKMVCNDSTLYECINSLSITAKVPGMFVKVIEWFYERRDQLGFSYTADLLDYQHPWIYDDVLDWFYSRPDIEFKYDHRSIDSASESGNTSVLNWWFKHRHQLQLKYTEASMDRMRYNMFRWWVRCKDHLELKYTNSSMDDGSHNMTLVWYDSRNDLELKYTSKVILNCMYNVCALKWWFDHTDELEFKYDPLMLQYLGNGCIGSLNLWLTRIDTYPLVLCTLNINNEVLEWCSNHLDKLTVECNTDNLMDGTVIIPINK